MIQNYYNKIEEEENVKANKKITVVTIILWIVLTCLVSFFGVYVQKQNRMENVLPDYMIGRDLKGSRTAVLKVDDTVNEKTYDKDGNLLEESSTEEIEGSTTVEEPVNKPEIVTKDNFLKSKQIIEKRLQSLGVNDYEIRLNKENGTMVLELPEDDKTDIYITYLNQSGKFTIVDKETQEVLIEEGHVKDAKIGYSQSETTGGLNAYITIAFDKEAKEKLREISKNYIQTTDEEGNKTTKYISVMLDDNTLTSTYFGEEITNGILQLPIGSNTSTTQEMQSYLLQATNVAMLIGNESLPIVYQLQEQKFIYSDITAQAQQLLIVMAAVVVVIMIIGLLVRDRKNGLLAGISLIGFIATILLVLRYTNVPLTISGVLALVVGVILYYILSILILNNIKKLGTTVDNTTMEIAMKDAVIRFGMIIIPIFILSLVFCFVNWAPMVSFGMVMFWCLAITAIYYYVITRTLLLNSTK